MDSNLYDFFKEGLGSKILLLSDAMNSNIVTELFYRLSEIGIEINEDSIREEECRIKAAGETIHLIVIDDIRLTLVGNRRKIVKTLTSPELEEVVIYTLKKLEYI